jgi:uncharacterized membrane protein YphA (DoxX/SURF4 family)
MHALRIIDVVSETEDGALFSVGALEFGAHVGILLGESTRLFSTQLIFTVT